MEQKQTPNIFEDDLVCKGEDRSRVGEVIRLGWVKDDDNDHDHDEGDECGGDDLEEHQVLVGWTSGELTKEDPKDLTVLERYVSLGDNVQRIPKDNNEQVVMGTVTGINMFLDIETKKGVLKNVHCENLKHVHPFQRDEFVITKKGKWIGRVFNTVCDVTILFEDGAACVIPEADSTVLKVIGQNQPQEEEQGEPSMAYQPGDLVRATKSILKEANWISGKNNPKRGMATVVDVQPSMIFVDWFSNADWEVKDDFPPGECTPKEIAMIDPFEKYNWGIGDICFLRKGLSDAKEVDQVLKSEFEKVPVGTLKAKNNNKGASVKTFLQTSTGKVVSMLTYINVLWQDGTTSEKILSTSVFPVNETSEKDYFPHEYVYSQDSQDVGVVQKVNLGDLTCDVQWAPGSNIPKERLNENGVEVNAPVYALREHPFNEFRLASAVIRLPAFKNNKNWCGFVTKTNGFKVEVTWNTGEVSEEDPKTLMSLGVNDDDDDLMDGEDDFMGEENEDESKDDDEGAHNQSDFVFNFGESKVVKPTKLESFTKVLEETDKLVVVLFGETWNMQCAQMMNSLDNFSNLFPDVTFVYVNVEEFKPTEANDSTSYPSFRIIHNKKVLSSLETSDENQLKSEVERWSQTVKPSSNTSATSSSTTNTSATSSETSSATTTGTTLDSFFLVSGAPNKHCFIVQQPQSVDPKIVHKELGNLNSALPKGCFVRAFDARLDILRVLVFGPENTPYTHTPFVFDVQLPLQYPTATPNIFFNSFVNEKMHPNLFVNGKVCSTLLGTYDDGIGELWGADSNLLTLCNHLQGSILNVAQPYFAEEDFEQLKGTKKGDFSSKVFSENSLLLSVRNTISFLKNNHFEEFKDIVPHFLKSQKASILDNLRKYLGQDVKVDQPIYSVPFEGTSVAFKKVLAPLYEELANLL